MTTGLVPIEQPDGGTLAISQDVADRARSARRPNTRKAQRQRWEQFEQWCDAAGLVALPATPSIVAEFLVYLDKSGRRSSTIAMASCAVSIRHKFARLPNPCTDELVKSVLKGIKIEQLERGIVQQQAKAMLDSDVDAIRQSAMLPRRTRGGLTESLEYAQRRGRWDIALVMFMRYAGTRISETVGVTWQDLDIQEDGSGRVTLRLTKTNQSDKGDIVAVKAEVVDAVLAIKPVDAQPSDRIFKLSTSHVTRRIKQAAKAAGLDHEAYSGHSPRVGMARELMRRGAPIMLIAQQGRWRTLQTVATYVRNESAGEILQYQ